MVPVPVRGRRREPPRRWHRLDDAGYVDVGWDVDGRDWAGGSAARLESRLVRQTLAHGDGAVVLLHGWPSATPVALGSTIRRLRDRGATFVRIDALGGLPGRRVARAVTAGADA